MEEDPFLAAGIDIPEELPYPELTGIINSVVEKLNDKSEPNSPKIKNKDSLMVLDSIALGASNTMLATAISTEEAVSDDIPEVTIESESTNENISALNGDSNLDIPEVTIENKNDEERDIDKRDDSAINDFNFMYPLEKRFMPEVSITSKEKYESNA